MSRVSYEFKLPEEKEQAEICFHAEEWKAVVCEMDKYIRNNIVHGDVSSSDLVLFQQFQMVLNDELNDRDLRL